MSPARRRVPPRREDDDVDAFRKKTGAQLWIQHDFRANQKLKKSPGYYE